jgi:hypothetical protein
MMKSEDCTRHLLGDAASMPLGLLDHYDFDAQNTLVAERNGEITI